MDEANKKAITGIGAAIVIGAVATGIAYFSTEANNYVAKVDGSRITQQDYDQAFQQVKGGPMGQFQSDDMLKHGVVGQLVDRKLVENEAAKRHVEPSDKEIQDKIDEIKKPYGTDEQFNKILEANHLTVNELKARIKTGLTMEDFAKDLAKTNTITENELREYYDKHKNAFQTEEEVRASHILVKDEAKAKELLKQLQGGADFATVAKANSIDGSKGQGGDLGFFGRGKMVPEFENAAFKLKPGQMSGLVKTQFGFHIIKVTDHHAAVAKSFDQVKDQVKDQLSKERQRDALEKWLADARKGAKIDYKAGYEPAPTPAPASPAPVGGAASGAAAPAPKGSLDPAAGGSAATPIPTAAASGNPGNSVKDHGIPTPSPSK